MTNAEHREIRLLVAHYRELDSAQRTRVDAHMLTCPECRLALTAYQAQDSLLLRTLPSRAPSPRLAASLRQALARRRQVSPCLLYTSPSPRDRTRSRLPSSA